MEFELSVTLGCFPLDSNNFTEAEAEDCQTQPGTRQSAYNNERNEKRLDRDGFRATEKKLDLCQQKIGLLGYVDIDGDRSRSGNFPGSVQDSRFPRPGASNAAQRPPTVPRNGRILTNSHQRLHLHI